MRMRTYQEFSLHLNPLHFLTTCFPHFSFSVQKAVRKIRDCTTQLQLVSPESEDLAEKLAQIRSAFKLVGVGVLRCCLVVVVGCLVGGGAVAIVDVVTAVVTDDAETIAIALVLIPVCC